MSRRAFDPAVLEAKAGEVAGLLKALANERRLLVLCHLVEAGEASVGELVDVVSLSQSALSQHLAVMRDEGLVAFRREGQTLWYRIADPRLADLLATLHRIYCAPGPVDQPERTRRPTTEKR